MGKAGIRRVRGLPTGRVRGWIRPWLDAGERRWVHRYEQAGNWKEGWMDPGIFQADPGDSACGDAACLGWGPRDPRG